jgi:hypothetical protein
MSGFARSAIRWAETEDSPAWWAAREAALQTRTTRAFWASALVWRASSERGVPCRKSSKRLADE